jgi:hypothetical protein
VCAAHTWPAVIIMPISCFSPCTWFIT